MEVHIGEKIAQVFQESGIKITELAKRMNTSQRNLYSIFKRKTITVDMLKEVSEALNYDFFELYSTSKSEVAEPEIKYSKATPTPIKMIIELDGEQSTLEKIIMHLRKLNSAIA
jgi:transcriptional regulator with XRE-family HTH domain